MAFTIISAGAGSGKTYRLTQEMVKKLNEGYLKFFFLPERVFFFHKNLKFSYK